MSTVINYKLEETSKSLYALCERIYPICRSITGAGVRQTLSILQDYIALQTKEIASGKKVLDWEVPKEWNVREAWIKDSAGNTIVDFKNNNLHLLNYSTPVHGKIDLKTLKDHLFTLPEQPALIPYRTSYYNKNWGFCITHHQYESLTDDSYEIFIDTTLEPGSLSYGELFIPGERKEEILFSTHICHPSLANDNCSGVSVLTHLARYLLTRRNRFSYRFIFIPGTIGSITWLAENKEQLNNIQGGLVASLLGDASDFTYKKSRRSNSEMDFIVQHVLRKLSLPHQVQNFEPYGYDERQFCAPGFDLPIGNLTRATYGSYPEYHTSADNLELISPANLEASLTLYQEIVNTLENCTYYENLFPYGEPQLGRRGLYSAIGGNSEAKHLQLAMLWILNYADGQHSLLHIAQLSGIKYRMLEQAAKLLLQKSVLREL